MYVLLCDRKISGSSVRSVKHIFRIYRKHTSIFLWQAVLYQKSAEKQQVPCYFQQAPCCFAAGPLLCCSRSPAVLQQMPCCFLAGHLLFSLFNSLPNFWKIKNKFGN